MAGTIIIDIIDGISIEGFIPSTGVGAAISAQLRALGANGPVTWSVDGGAFPDDLAIGAGTGLITGTADTPGNFSVTIRAADTAGRYARRPFAWRVQYLPITILGDAPVFVVGEECEDVLTLSGGSGTYASVEVIAGALPAGVSAALIAGQLEFVGTTFVIGVWSATIRVTDSLGATATRVIAGAVAAPPPLEITGAPLADAQVGNAYSETLTVAGGVPPYSLTAVTGLPAGLSANLAGSTITISGTPAAGTDTSSPYSVGVAVEDALATQASITPSLVVTQVYQPWVVSSLPSNCSASNADFRITRSGGADASRIVVHPLSRSAGKFALRFRAQVTSTGGSVCVGFRNGSTGSYLGGTASGWGMWWAGSTGGVVNRIWHNAMQNILGGNVGAGEVELMLEVDFGAGVAWMGAAGSWFAGNPFAGTGAPMTGLTGTLELALDMFYGGYVELLRPVDFTTPATTGFTPGWPG